MLRRRLPAFGLLALLATFAACGDTLEPALPEPGTPEPPTPPPVYQVPPPEGKLPWPHHDPSWDEARYDAMIRDLWVVNNFGLYQGGWDNLYLHLALDVVLPNGTVIFAIEPGVVRARLGSSQYYATLLIEDLDRPGWGWGYTHISFFTVAPGDTVHRGTPIGQVNFLGLEHIHLGRYQLRTGGLWSNFDDLITVQPDTFFVYIDTEPPVFEGRFRYVRAGTDNAFVAPGPDESVTVSGDVDIVVGLRDPGEWARSGPLDGGDTYGDRNSPNRVEYEIEGPDGVIVSAVAFDLSRLRIPLRTSQADNRAQVLTLYQHYGLVNPPGPPTGNNNRRFNYYVLTNSDGSDEVRTLNPANPPHAWLTAEVGPDGARRFPDGEYIITVKAYDFKGNMATRSETVRVANPLPAPTP